MGRIISIFSMSIVIFAGALMIIPIVVLAAPLKKATDKIGKSQCPYSCQSAIVDVDALGSVTGACFPNTDVLIPAENVSHPMRGDRPSNAQQLHLECEQIQCGILEYTAQSGETYRVDRCTRSYAEGDVIPSERPEDNPDSSMFRNERVINPDLFSKNSSGGVFDELRGLFSSPQIEQEGSEPMREIVDEGILRDFYEFETYQYEHGDLNPTQRSDTRLPPEYRPAIPFVPSGGERANVEIGGDTYSVPKESLEQAREEYYQREYESLKSRVYDTQALSLYGNTNTFCATLGFGCEPTTFSSLEYSDSSMSPSLSSPQQHSPGILERAGKSIGDAVKGIGNFLRSFLPVSAPSPPAIPVSGGIRG